MLKRMKRVAMDPSPSYMDDEEVRARLKFQSLLQDYQELFKETEATKIQLQRTKQRKSLLKAEVRFLRKRYRHLMAVRSQSPKAEPAPPRLTNPEIRGELLPEKKSYRAKEALLPNNPVPEKKSYKAKQAAARLPNHTVFDLNQVSRGEEEEEFQFLGPVGVETQPSNYLGPVYEGDEQPTDLNLAVYRDIGNVPSRAGKRKISWSDQVALRV